MQETDFIVVGAGVAGLRAAIALAEAGRVLVIAKEALTESNTQYAQGGVAVALSDEDEVGLHLQDTIAAGDGLVNEEVARVLVEEGPQRIQELIDWGTAFDRAGTKLTFTREAAHSRSRVLHAHGDSTGREIGRALAAKAATLPHITFATHLFSNDLLHHDGRVCGVEAIDSSGALQQICARGVLLATGGAGQVYSDTTNPPVATGDGIAMAYRAGATISDMEFFQFHPTALAIRGAPRFLISEAVRGEGAYLRNEKGERFMQAVDSRAELAPRDVVARAISLELARTKAASVFLDLRHLNSHLIRERFPRIAATCSTFGIDITLDLIPVRPAAHYLMGGVKTELDGHSSISGLFAAGETACTGVHGANRLASNSLLEGLVFGARSGEAMRNLATVGHSLEQSDRTATPSMDVGRLRALMWECAGVVRSGEKLRAALNELTTAPKQDAHLDRVHGEARNLQQCAELIVRSAIAREESRGAHYRTDFPVHDDTRFRKHSIVQGQVIRFA